MYRVTQTARLTQPSAYQSAIFDFIESGRGHGVVEATAGSGKTTTLVEVAHRLPRSARARFVAFNKSAARQLKQKLPAHVKASTLHGLGYKALADYIHAHHAALAEASSETDALPPLTLEPNPKKYGVLAREALTGLKRYRLDPDTQRAASDYIKRLFRYVRVTLTDLQDPDALYALAARYELNPLGDAELVKDLHYSLRWLLEAGRRQARRGNFDFDDMIYLPVTESLPVEQYDFLCVDEAQDLSRMQLALVMRAVKPTGRLLFVGDRRQAIYGFTGADTKAMDRIIHETDATVLPLSVTYRCPRSHVHLAKRFAPEITAAPRADQGRVEVIGEHAFASSVRPGDLVLCRTNAPLVRVCLALIQAGTPAVVRGHDLSATLVKDAQRAYKSSLTGWETKLETFEQREMTRLETTLPDDLIKAAVARRQDELTCLEALTRHAVAAGLQSTQALTARIRDTFGDKARTVTLSSVHRAKGQEATRVYLL